MARSARYGAKGERTAFLSPSVIIRMGSPPSRRYSDTGPTCIHRRDPCMVQGTSSRRVRPPKASAMQHTRRVRRTRLPSGSTYDGLAEDGGVQPTIGVTHLVVRRE